MKYTTLLLLLALPGFGCASYDAGGADASPANGAQNNSYEGNNSAGSEPYVAGLDALYAHDVQAARDELADAPRQDRRAMAGLAIVEVLALPMSTELNDVLSGSLGATRSVTNDLIYGEDGLLYLVSRGVPWEDGESLAGIRTILGEELPWQRERLESSDAFFSGLREPVDLLADRLVALANGPIQRAREAAADALQGGLTFEPFVVPGTVFFDMNLELSIGPSEVALLDAVLAAGQAAVHAIAAYENAWTLERAFGTTVWHEVLEDIEHPLHVEGASVEDYQIAHLNEHVLRAVRSSEHLSTSQDALAEAFGQLATSLRLAVTTTGTPATLDWSTVTNEVLTDLAEVAEAFQAGVRGSSTIPHTEPQLTVDLTPLFSPGRVLPPDVDLIQSVEIMDELGTTTGSEINDEAFELLIDGLFDPPPGMDGPVLTTVDDLGALVDDVIGHYQREIERAVEGTF